MSSDLPVVINVRHEVIQERPSKTVSLAVHEMSRLYRRTDAIREPIHWIRNLGWACVALAPGALLGWIPWLAAYESLSQDAQVRFAWVTPAFLITGIAAVLIAVVCYFMNRSHQHEIRHDKQAALDLLDAIAERHGLSKGFLELGTPSDDKPAAPRS